MEAVEGVTLVPFIHQVGGHSGILAYDESTICKPVTPAELHFYETLAPEIAQFTPRFKGVAHVTVHEDDDGSVKLRAHRLASQLHPKVLLQARNAPELDQIRNSKERLLQNTRSRCSHSKSSSGNERLFVDHSERKPAHRLHERGNPWGVHLNRVQLARMHSGGKVHKFILLENLTSRFRFPCILDIKLGTRTYRMDQSEEKRKMHKDRDASTTTASLGLRICGMQVYQPSTSSYKCCNKYDGRHLTKDSIRKALSEYLFDGGEGRRADLVAPFVERAAAIVRTISAFRTQSFLCSSLLLIYEGDTDRSATMSPSTPAPSNTVDLKIIDFAGTAKEQGVYDSSQDGNRGFVYGLRNLIQILNDLQSTA